PERFEQGASEHRLTPDGHALLDALRARLPATWQRADISAFPFGRAAGALALQRASALLGNGTLVICGGLDSQHDWAVLDALQRADRLLGPENVDGVRPGEAAAFIVLDRATPDEAALNVLALGLAREPHPVGSETQSMAR